MRRIVLLGAMLALTCCGRAEEARRDPPAKPLREIEKTRGPARLTADLQAAGRLAGGAWGVTVMAVSDGWTARGGEHDRPLPQQSVSKLWVAITALDAVDRGQLDMSAIVPVTRSDLTVFNQPIAHRIGPRGIRVTPSELLHLSLTRSDNTANDVLMRYVGGADAVAAMLGRKGIEGVSFGPGERLLQSGIAGVSWQAGMQEPGAFEYARRQVPAARRAAAYAAYVGSPPDGATPDGVATALVRLKRGDLLSPGSTRAMLATMSQTVTGHARIRAGLPAGWTVAHKTGTGQSLRGRQAGFNDVGIVTAPDGRSYAIAAMIGDGASVRSCQRAIAAMTRAVVAQHDRDHPPELMADAIGGR